MKILLNIKHSLFLALLSLSLVMMLAPVAQADTVDDFISKYQQIEKLVPPGSSLPITSEQLISVQSLFRCVDGGNVGTCTDDFSKTETGKKIIENNEIPTSVMDVLHAYAAYKDGDVWGVAYYLGEAAVCAVVQVLAGGVDICGLIKQLIQLGKDIWNAAVAAYDWFIDVGGAIIESLASAGCSIGLCCCDDSPPPAEWQLVYAGYFAPRLADGLSAIEAKYFSGLPMLIQQIKSVVGSQCSYGAFDTASNEFKKTVDGAWTADVVPKKLNELNAKRALYTTPQTIATAVAASVTVEKPDQTVVSTCKNDFEKMSFGHIDRWKTAHPDLAKKLAVEENVSWCRNKFFNDNMDKFAQQYRQYLHSHSCPQMGLKMYCTTTDAYKSCMRIMGSVKRQGECLVNTAIAGPVAAQQIKGKMIEKGSQQQLYPCNSINPNGPSSTQPTQLVCSRPAQTNYCTKINNELFGELPQVLVSCNLQESTDYKALRQAVQLARKQLILKYFSLAVKEDFSDPLIAYVGSSEDLAQLGKDPLNNSFKFPPPSTQPGFSYAMKFEGSKPVIDGVNAAEITYLMPQPEFGNKGLTKPKYEEKLRPADPRVNPDPGQYIGKGMLVSKELEKLANTQKTPVQAVVKGTAANKTESVNKSMASNVARQAVLAAPAGQVAAPAQTKQQVMSGSLPQGQQISPPACGIGCQQLSGIKPTDKSPVKALVVAGKPDLVSAGKLTIAGVTTQWGGSIILNGQQVQTATNGLCSATITYAVQNIGTVPAAFGSKLLSSAQQTPILKQWSSLNSGATQIQTEQVLLRPGQNVLTLTIDPEKKVNELSETNNQVNLMVVLSGNCQQQTQKIRQVPMIPVKPPLR